MSNSFSVMSDRQCMVCQHDSAVCAARMQQDASSVIKSVQNATKYQVKCTKMLERILCKSMRRCNEGHEKKKNT